MKAKRAGQAALLLTIILVAGWRVASLGTAERNRLARKAPKGGGAIPGQGLSEGAKAPDFDLKRSGEGEVSLTSLLKKGDSFLWFFQPG